MAARARSGRGAARGRADRPGAGRAVRPIGTLTITTFNLQNLFDLIAEPGRRDSGSMPSPVELEIKLEKLSLAVRRELLCPQLIAVQEVDNRDVLQELGDRVNHAAGTRYIAVSYETSDPRSTEVGFLYDAARIALRDSFQMSGPDVERAFGGYSPSPGREPIVGVFEARGIELTVIGNHFKSRGGFVLERATEDQRRDQARVVRRFADDLLGRDPGALIAVAGDFNDFHSIDPESLDPRPLAILRGSEGEVPLLDVVERVPPEDRYTFVYRGAGLVLDHILVSPAMADSIAGVDILHFNAGHPLEYAGEIGTPVRCSDHDPVELRLDFGREAPFAPPGDG